MIRPQLQTAPAAPATLVSLARVGIAGLSMASLLQADATAPAASSVAPSVASDVATPALGAAPTIHRIRAAV